MGVTGSSAEATYLTAPGPIEPDYDLPVTNEDLVAALEASTRAVDEDEFVDVVVRGNDSIGL